MNHASEPTLFSFRLILDKAVVVSHTMITTFHDILYQGKFTFTISTANIYFIALFKVHIAPIVTPRPLTRKERHIVVFPVNPSVIASVCLYAQRHHPVMERIALRKEARYLLYLFVAHTHSLSKSIMLSAVITASQSVISYSIHSSPTLMITETLLISSPQ